MASEKLIYTVDAYGKPVLHSSQTVCSLGSMCYGHPHSMQSKKDSYHFWYTSTKREHIDKFEVVHGKLFQYTDELLIKLLQSPLFGTLRDDQMRSMLLLFKTHSSYSKCIDVIRIPEMFPCYSDFTHEVAILEALLITVVGLCEFKFDGKYTFVAC